MLTRLPVKVLLFQALQKPSRVLHEAGMIMLKALAKDDVSDHNAEILNVILTLLASYTWMGGNKRKNINICGIFLGEVHHSSTGSRTLVQVKHHRLYLF
jgi:hypothetical protein